jgi:hypothetical protein
MPRKRISKPVEVYLWSESGGHCQNPKCRLDLHKISTRNPISELAHIIPASIAGPRGEEDPDLDDNQRAEASNILLLCPTCHSMIDKDADTYPTEILREWKQRSQAARNRAFGTSLVGTREEARARWVSLLSINSNIFARYGPRDSVFDEDQAAMWAKLVSSQIIPNNRAILAFARANEHLLHENELMIIAEFELHAGQLESRHLYGDWSSSTLQFPDEMKHVFQS